MVTTTAGGKREEDAVLVLVRELIERGMPFTIGIEDAPGGRENFEILHGGRIAFEVAAGNCKRYAWVPGVGLVCIEH